ncbi:prefoldin subunit 1 [Onthophagus taurus]|uniref:prefoldin subunit 1 n=1 Tax=Onthophagus taurus TaxID=166361 RepID=UPI000C20866F|nr:prefoldin subunit 1 [Onthophagus taurus]
MSHAVDLELKQAFTELQAKQQMTKEVIQNCQRNIEVARRCKQIATLTHLEVKNLDENVKIYESLGRCFVMTPREEVIENLQTKIDEYTKEGKQETEKIQLAEGKLKEAENSLRELVQQKKTRS